jgi:hypothetical protein
MTAPPENPEQPTVKKDKDHPFYVRDKSTYRAKEGQKLYEATGESGQIAVQSHAEEMTFALSWADPEYWGTRADHIRAGVVRNFYTTKDKAMRSRDRMAKAYPHCTFVVVEAREFKP